MVVQYVQILPKRRKKNKKNKTQRALHLHLFDELFEVFVPLPEFQNFKNHPVVMSDPNGSSCHENRHNHEILYLASGTAHHGEVRVRMWLIHPETKMLCYPSVMTK